MGIFNKKITLDEILKAISDLSEEEKAKLIGTLSDGKTEETATDASEDANNVTDCGKDCASKEETNAAEEVAETPEETGEDAPENQTSQDTSAEENRDDVIQILSARVGDLEEKIAKIDKLRDRMEEYERKTAERLR